MKNLKILIAGGGIGGLCTALALRQRGFDAHIYEAAPEVRAAGAGIILAPNAMNVLARLGLAEAAQARGFALDRVQLADAAGRPLVTPPARDALTREFGFGMTAITRPLLYQMLLDALPQGTVLTGKRVTGCEQDAQQVSLIFENSERVHADAVLAAEGIGSTIRRALFPDIKPRYSGQTSYRGIASITLPSEFADHALECWGEPVRFGIVPVATDRVYWFATQRAPQGGTDTSPEAARSALLASVADFAVPARAIIEATRPQDMIRTDIADLPPLPVWHSGRIALLGDAAHATTPNLGQGGCQAIEDAWFIAEALEGEPDLESAYRRYTRIRKPRADHVVAQSWRFSTMVHFERAWQRGLRNALLRMIPASAAMSQMRGIFALPG
jgi:2-polyprenyl-6-methoxyphenol hydroxylase-like FAD-dependent oxidoreductase